MIELDTRYHIFIFLILSMGIMMPYNIWLIFFLCALVTIRNFYVGVLLFMLYEISTVGILFYDKESGIHNSLILIVVFFVLNKFFEKYYAS